MFSKPQIHHKSPPRPNSTMIPNSFDIKNMPNLTAPPESPENPKIKFKNQKLYEKIGNLCPNQRKLGDP